MSYILQLYQSHVWTNNVS